MRRLAIGIAALALILTACAEDEPAVGGGSPTGGAAPATAAECAERNADAFESPGTLTVGTGNPAYPPWWEGGESEGSEFKFNDPANGEGYEGAVVADVAGRLGFSFPDEVTFVAVGFNKSFAPGPKPFDFVLQQIAATPERDEAVDFSESYYDANQGLVTYEGSPIADATSIEDLKDAALGAPIGTTSLDVIEDVIQPDTEPQVYDDLAGAVQDLKNGAIDGVIADVPTAFIIAAVDIPKGVVIGQFETEATESFGMVFETDSPLVECVNLALQEMKDEGVLAQIEQEWLAEKTNTPVLS